MTKTLSILSHKNYNLNLMELYIAYIDPQFPNIFKVYDQL